MAFNGRIVKSPNFERALSKNTNLEPLNNEGKSTLKVFAGEGVETTDEVPQSLADRALGKKKKTQMPNLETKMDPINIQHCRKAIQLSKHEFTDYRKSLLPVNLQSQISLSVNWDFWSVHTVKSLI